MPTEISSESARAASTPDVERWQRAGAKLRKYAPEAFALAVAAFQAGTSGDDPIPPNTDTTARQVCELVRQLEQLGAVNPAGLAACVQLLDDLLARDVRPTARAALDAAFPEASHA